MAGLTPIPTLDLKSTTNRAVIGPRQALPFPVTLSREVDQEEGQIVTITQRVAQGLSTSAA